MYVVSFPLHAMYLSVLFRKCRGWSSGAIKHCQILCYWLLMLWKPPSVEGNPLSQGLYQGVLQIVFQGGLNASWNGKGGKACLCVRVCVHGWANGRVSTSAKFLTLWAFQYLSETRLTRTTDFRILRRLFKLSNLNQIAHPPVPANLQLNLTLWGDHTSQVSNVCFMSYKYTLLHTSLRIVWQ